jgi:hypothetical protein
VEEASFVDGCTRFTVLRERSSYRWPSPRLAAPGAFSLFSYSEFFLAMLVTSSALLARFLRRFITSDLVASIERS